MTEWLKVILLGIIEGITEWLPISSTGHLILVNAFLRLQQTEDFIEVFQIVIQFGAIMAVLALYWKSLFPDSSLPKEKRDSIKLWIKIGIACIPATIIGLPLDNWMEKHLHNVFVVASMLILYGFFFLLIEHSKYKNSSNSHVRSLEELSYLDALKIGCFQVLSLVPGTSRSGATILGGMLIGTTREVAAEFTFFLAIPVLFGASIIKFLKYGVIFSFIELITLVVGMTTSFIVSVIAIRFFMKFIKSHDFKVFGWYRILLGTLILLAWVKKVI